MIKKKKKNISHIERVQIPVNTEKREIKKRNRSVLQKTKRKQHEKRRTSTTDEEKKPASPCTAFRKQNELPFSVLSFLLPCSSCSLAPLLQHDMFVRITPIQYIHSLLKSMFRSVLRLTSSGGCCLREDKYWLFKKKKGELLLLFSLVSTGFHVSFYNLLRLRV